MILPIVDAIQPSLLQGEDRVERLLALDGHKRPIRAVCMPSPPNFGASGLPRRLRILHHSRPRVLSYAGGWKRSRTADSRTKPSFAVRRKDSKHGRTASSTSTNAGAKATRLGGAPGVRAQHRQTGSTMAFLVPPGTPEWLLGVYVGAAIITGVFLSLAGPIRAAQVFVHAIAGLLRSCSEVRDEWGKLWYGDTPRRH